MFLGACQLSQERIVNSIPRTEVANPIQENEAKFLPEYTPHDRLFGELYRLGFVDASGYVIEEKFKDFKLPPLNKDQIESVSQLLTHFFKIYNKQMNLQDCLAYLQVYNKQIEGIEIVGGFVRKLIFQSLEYCKQAFRLLDLEHLIDTDLIEACRLPVSDYDIRINFSQDPKILRDLIIRYLTFNQFHSVDPNAQNELISSAFTKYTTVKSDNHFSILSFGDQKGEDIEILVINYLERKHLFASDALRLDITNFQLSEPLVLKSDYTGGWQSFIDLLTRRIHVKDLPGVNNNGLALLISYMTRGFTWCDKQIGEAVKNVTVESLEKCLENHFKNDPCGRFVFLLNARAFIGKHVTFTQCEVKKKDDPILYQIYQILSQSPDKFDLIYAMLHVAAFECLGGLGKLKSVLKTHEDVLALQIQFGGNYLLLPVDLEKAFRLISTEHHPKNFDLFESNFVPSKEWKTMMPSNEVILASTRAEVWMLSLMNSELVLKAYSLWKAISNKKTFAKEMLLSLAPMHPCDALVVMKEFPQDSSTFSMLVASFQQTCHSIAMQRSLDDLYQIMQKVLSKKRPAQKMLLQNDPFTGRILWLVDQLPLEQARAIFSKAIFNFWIPEGDSNVQKVWMSLCNRTLEISPEIASDYYSSLEKKFNFPREGMEFLLQLTEKLLHQNLEAGLWIKQVHEKCVDRDLTELFQKYISNLIPRDAKRANVEFEVYKSRFTVHKRTSILLRLFEALVDQKDLDKAGSCLKQLSQSTLSEDEKAKICTFIEANPCKEFLVISGFLSLQRKIDLTLVEVSKNDDPELISSLIRDVIVLNNRPKIVKAIAAILKNKLSASLIKELKVHFLEFGEALKAENAHETLEDLMLSIQPQGIPFELWNWVAERASTARVFMLFSLLPRGNFPEPVVSTIFKTTKQLLKTENLPQKTLKSLSNYLLLCPASSHCEKIAAFVTDQSLALDLLMHSSLTDWAILQEIVTKISRTKDNALKKKIEPVIRKFQKDDSEACKQTLVLGLNILIELKDSRIATYLDTVEQHDPDYLHVLVRGCIPLIEKKPLYATKLAELLLANDAPYADVLFIQFLVREVDLEFFKLAVRLFNTHFESIYSYFIDKKMLNGIFVIIYQFIGIWHPLPKAFRPLFTDALHEDSPLTPITSMHGIQKEGYVMIKVPEDYRELVKKCSMVAVPQIHMECFNALLFLNEFGEDSLAYHLAKEISISKYWVKYFQLSFEFMTSAKKAVKHLKIFLEHHHRLDKKDKIAIRELVLDYVTCHIVVFGEVAELIDVRNQILSVFLIDKVDLDKCQTFELIFKYSVSQPEFKFKAREVLCCYLKIFDRMHVADEEREGFYTLFESVFLICAECFPDEMEFWISSLRGFIYIFIGKNHSQEDFEKSKARVVSFLNSLWKFAPLTKESLFSYSFYFGIETTASHFWPFILSQIILAQENCTPFNLSRLMDLVNPALDPFLQEIYDGRNEAESTLILIVELLCKKCDNYHMFVEDPKLLIKINHFMKAVRKKFKDYKPNDSKFPKVIFNDWFTCLECRGIECIVGASKQSKVKDVITMTKTEAMADLMEGFPRIIKAGLLSVDIKLNINFFKFYQKQITRQLDMYDEMKLYDHVNRLVDYVTDMLCFVETEEDKNRHADRELWKQIWVATLKKSTKTFIQAQSKRVNDSYRHN